MKFIKRYWLYALLFTVALVSWRLSAHLFEDSQSSVGPDFIARVPVKVFALACALLGTRLVIWFMFPTIREWTNTKGGEEISEFRRSWEAGGMKPGGGFDHRLTLCILAFVGTFLVVSQILLSF